MKITTRHLTVEIAHPKDPGFWVKLRKLDFIELMELYQANIRAEIKEAVIDPATGRPFMKTLAHGTLSPLVRRTGMYPHRHIVETLDRVVEACGGLEGDGGSRAFQRVRGGAQR